MSNFSEDVYTALTKAQRLVLQSFRYSATILTIAEIYAETEQRISVKTIRRAVKKLCQMGVLRRMEAKKKGRGYTHLYQLAEE